MFLFRHLLKCTTKTSIQYSDISHHTSNSIVLHFKLAIAIINYVFTNDDR